MRSAPLLAALALLAPALPGQATREGTAAQGLEQIVERALGTQSPSGREDLAWIHDLLRERAGNRLAVDRLGSLTLTLGEGRPRRLVAVAVDEPGYVVSRIQDDGYLRVVPVVEGTHPQWHASAFGRIVGVQTSEGLVPAVTAIPSTHLGRLQRSVLERTFHDLHLDLGAGSAEEVRALGVRELDPVIFREAPVRLRDGRWSGREARVRAVAGALASVAWRALAGGVEPGEGSVVLAWTVQDLLNRKGIEAVAVREGPFDTVALSSRGLDGEHGVLRAPDPGGVAHRAPRPGPATGGPHFGAAEVTYFGLGARRAGTPVETISGEDLIELEVFLAQAAGLDLGAASSARVALAPRVGPRPAPEPASREELVRVLRRLAETPGVSGAEGPVRREIEGALPAEWAPEVDNLGNLFVSVGPEGGEHLVFVAHMDETGFGVSEIRSDGTLQLERRGGFYPWLWHGRPARVHLAGGGGVAGVFLPDADQVDVGASSAAEARALGITTEATVTMPKELVRLGDHRAVARSFDDRAGSTALVLAARRLLALDLPRRVTLAWSVEEEVGLVGAAGLAERFRDATLVHAVDTHVSSDSPLEEPRYAYSELGGGAVLRALESILFVSRAQMERVQGVAARAGVPLQVAMTHGGTDGQPFLAYGVPSVPISWPGRYSHSPVEVLDLRDLEALVDLVVALATDPAPLDATSR